MSGIEIAGLVLGSFPILLNCLDYYREGFEPLEEWWNFRTHFIVFVDDIRHQMMKYNENMIRLLDPIVPDNSSLTVLVRNPKDPRWTDGSLAGLLEQRLASEHGRFLRIVQRMEGVVGELKKLLRIEEGNVNWIGSEQQRPWEWHLKRFQISFSKGKTKKVKKLAAHNQELQDILGYSERVIPIADSRKSSEPVAFFEKMRQHACAMHNAIMRNWKCSSRACRTHQANLCLRSETKTIEFNVLFILEDGQGSLSKPKKQEVTIQPVEDNSATHQTATQVSYVQQAESFTAVQERFKNVNKNEKRSSLSEIFSKTPNAPSTLSPVSGKAHSKREKLARFVAPMPAITISQHNHAEISQATSTASSNVTSRRITDLCSSLQNCPNPDLGVLIDDFDRKFELSKIIGPGSATAAPDTVRLVPLTELLDAHHQTSIDIARQRRFEMAIHIASALLQIQTSPWLSSRWSKDEFLFLADSQSVHSNYPYISKLFSSTSTDLSAASNSLSPPPSVSEEEIRASLFSVGVVILELIFGHTIQACTFRHLYYGSNNQPNDLTDVSTARKWSQKVLGECGAEIADVVRRCLDCSFGPRPNLKDTRFREAVYEGVIRPLADYLKTWQVVIP